MLVGSLEFPLRVVAQLFRSCLCLFDAIVELHAMGKKIFDDFLSRKRTWISHVIKAYSIHDLYLHM